MKRGELDLLLQRYEIHNIVTPFKNHTVGITSAFIASCQPLIPLPASSPTLPDPVAFTLMMVWKWERRFINQTDFSKSNLYVNEA